MNEPLVVRRETQIAAPPATVFAFLTDPEKIVSWMGVEATTEAHPGGLYLLKGVGGDHARVARGAFREVVPVPVLPTPSGGRAAKRSRRDRAWSKLISMECALDSGQFQAAFLTGCWACRSSYCAGLR